MAGNVVNTLACSGKKMIALLQFTANQFKAENFKVCESLITDAKARGAEVSTVSFFLPEIFVYVTLDGSVTRLNYVLSISDGVSTGRIRLHR